MISYSHILEIFFEIVLFLLLALLLCRFFLFNVLPQLYKQIKDIKDYHESLNQKFLNTKKMVMAVEKEISEEKEKIVDVESKIRSWHESEVAKSQEEKIKFDLTCKKIIDKRMIQRANLKLICFQNDVIPTALEEVVLELKTKDENQKLVVFDSILAFIGKK